MCEGSFFLPSGFIVFDCGTKKFEIRDVSGSGNQANALSLAVANYTSQGTLQTYQKNYTSTRIIHIEGDQDVVTKIVSKGGDGGDGNDNWPPDPKPEKDTTYSNNQCYGTGITSFTLPKSSKSSNNSSFGASSTTYSNQLTKDQKDALGGYGAYSYSGTSSSSYTTQSTINSSTGSWGWAVG